MMLFWFPGVSDHRPLIQYPPSWSLPHKNVEKGYGEVQVDVCLNLLRAIDSGARPTVTFTMCWGAGTWQAPPMSVETDRAACVGVTAARGLPDCPPETLLTSHRFRGELGELGLLPPGS